MQTLYSKNASSRGQAQQLQNRLLPFGSLAGLVVLAILSFLFGRYPVSPWQVVQVIIGRLTDTAGNFDESVQTVVWNIRLPRIMGTIMAGGALSVSGLVYQRLFRNPLVSPDILGVSAGAGFGASLALLLSMPWALLPPFAFGFGLIAVACSLFVTRIVSNGSSMMIILSGVVVSAIFQALISIAKYVADPQDTLPGIVFWLMGGFSGLNNSQLWVTSVAILIPFIVLLGLRWPLQVMSSGEEEARSLGVPVVHIRWIVIICATLLTAAATSMGGIIGWVGLLVPHMARALVGENIVRSLPVAFIVGSMLLLVVDTFARSIGSTEIPLGILTALLGAPFFLILLVRGGRRKR